MRPHLTILAFVVVLAADPGSVFSQERIWKDSTGGYTVQAELIDIVDGQVVLKKQNGNVIKVPLSVLSAEDQKFIRDLEKPKVDPLTAPKSEPTTTNAASRPPNDELPSADVELTPRKPESKDPLLVSLAARTRAFIRFDPTHFDLTDIPPRPTRPPKTRLAGDDIAGIDEPAPEPLTESAVNDESVTELEAEVNSDQSEASPMVAPAIELTVDEVNLLPNQYSLIGRTLYSNDDTQKSREALDQLVQNWPASRNETILKLVRKTTTCDNKVCRLKAMNLLGKHDFDESLPYLLARLDDDDDNIRWAALELMGQTQDPRALQPVIERFASSDRAKVSSVLVLYGSQAELGLHPFLSNQRADIRMEASLLLGKLGTAESIPKLESLATTDDNPIVALQAKSAIRQIKKRLGLD